MLRKIISYSLVLCLSLLLNISGAAQAAGNEHISLAAANASPTLNDQVQVTISGNDLTNLYAYELALRYDTDHLQFIGAASVSGGFTLAPIVSKGTILLPHTEIGDTAGMSGDMTLATLTFQAIQTGQAQIGLTNLKLMDAQLAAKQVTSDAQLSLHIQPAATSGSSDTTGESAPAIEDAQTGVTYNAVTKRVTSVLDLAAFTKAQDQTESDANGKKIVELKIAPMADAKQYVQVLPSKALTGETPLLSVRVQTPLATILLPGDMFKGTVLPSEAIGLHIALAEPASAGSQVQAEVGNHPILELSFHAEDAYIAWNKASSPVIISMPYKPTGLELMNPEHIVVRYIDAAGAIQAVPSGKYNSATGEVTFVITHFGQYAIAYVTRTFDDLIAADWAKHPIEVMASKGVVNGVSESTFEPSKAITRADFLVLLLRTLELQGKQGTPFADVSEQAYYSDALRTARELGIAAGYEGNVFKPLDPITREEMMVLTARALKAGHYDIQASSSAASRPFLDASDIAEYAKESVNLLAGADLVHGYDQKIHPKETTTRAETVVLMYNIYDH